MNRFPTLRARGLWPAAVIVTAGALAAPALGALPASAAPSGARTTPSGTYRQFNFASDRPLVPGLLRDHDLINAWGLAASPGTDAKPGSPLWVADNGTGKATLYAGTKNTGVVRKQGLVVNVTGADPTGQVFNPFSHAFGISDGHGHHAPALFIFDTENGTIDGWSPSVGAAGRAPATTTVIARRTPHAVYKGLAIARASGQPVLYAANFGSGQVEVYNRSFRRITLPGGRFADPALPARYAPFNVAEIRGQLYVAYAKQNKSRTEDLEGAGHGYVDVFANDGKLVRRLISAGPLNSPWGMALAPASFGLFGGDLLVGNFGDGHINAFDPASGAHLGQLHRQNGNPLVVDGLWALMFGNGNAAKTSELLFSAGPFDEHDGQIGKITANTP